MKISIITVCFNSVNTIEQTIHSVLNQTHNNVEFIVVDGNSNDGTQNIINKYSASIAHYVSEPDKGIYDAMNKGLSLANGDIIGILNSDDVYKNSEVLARVAKEFEQNIECLCTDVEIFKNDTNHVIRYYSCTRWKPWMFRIGHQPPHPGFFAKRVCYETLGNFNTEYKLGADFDLLLRFISHYLNKTAFMPWVTVSMRGGGASQKSFKNIALANREVNQSLKSHGYFSSIVLIWLKYPLKIFQFIFR